MSWDCVGIRFDVFSAFFSLDHLLELFPTRFRVAAAQVRHVAVVQEARHFARGESVSEHRHRLAEARTYGLRVDVIYGIDNDHIISRRSDGHVSTGYDKRYGEYM
jgi:hypothetical protein